MKFIRHFRDVLRFNQLSSQNNKICIYCEGENYWPHLKPIVEQLLTQSDININFVTSSERDPGLGINHPQLSTFVIGEGFIRNYFFDNLKSSLVIMTMPDLDQYQIKKSEHVRQYIYVHHSMVSHHMVYRPKAFDAFDVIMCAGPHHKTEILAMVNVWDMPPKKLINHGYGRLDSIISNQVRAANDAQNETNTVLVAPSWGENCTLELMGERLIDALMALKLRVILRPHPQTIKFSQQKISTIVKKYKNNDFFYFDQNVSSEKSLHESDLMISDWSGAALDYAFGLLKPVLFMDVPRKVQNHDFEQLAPEPFEATIRPEIGCIQSADMNDLAKNIKRLLDDKNAWSQRLAVLRDKHVYNLGNSGHVAAKAILELV